jgi:hypothetical protein
VSEQTPRSREPGGRTVLELIDASGRLWEREDWEGMRALHHPSSRTTSLAADGSLVARGPDEAMEELRRAWNDQLLSRSVEERWLVDDHVGIARGRVRYKRRDGYITHDERVWLYVERDGLLFRIAVFNTAADAERAYRTKGPDLGIS